MTGPCRIVRGVGGFYYVHTDEGIFECRARGIFRKQHIKPLVGDLVEIDIIDREKKIGNVTEIKPRSSSLIRPAVANIDQAFVVFAGAKPDPNLNLLDRFLVMMAAKDIPVVIVINKSDITDSERLASLKSIYSPYYRVIDISVLNCTGLNELKELLKNRFTVFAGPSGVGKSSLTNYLVPDADMETGDISRKIERGKQTTRHAELFYAGDGAYICDTPGFGSLELFDIDKNDLKYFFPEFAVHSDNCRFKGCVHIGERECGVKDAVRAGLIAKSRYDDYRLMYEELADRRQF